MYNFDKVFGGVDIGKISIGDELFYVMIHDSEVEESNEYFDGESYRIASHGDVIVWSTKGNCSVVFHCSDDGKYVEKIVNGRKVSVATFDDYVKINIC